MTLCDHQLSSVQERCTFMLVCLIFEPVIWLSCISCSKTASLHCEGLWTCTHSNRKGLSMMNLKEQSSCVSGIYTTCSWCHTILVKFAFLFLSWLRWSEKVKLTKISVLHILFYSVIRNRANKSLDLVTTETCRLVFHVKMSRCGWERKQWILCLLTSKVWLLFIMHSISVQFYLDSTTSQQQSPRGTFNN